MSYVHSLGLKVPRKKALDFGCGVGRLTQSLADHFSEVCGLDIASSMIELANKYNRHGDKCRYYLNQHPDLKLFDDNDFDFIYSNITLQHMAPVYSQKYIQEFLRILSPEGLLVFQLPDAPATIHQKTLRQAIKSLTPNALLMAYRKLRYGGIKPVMRMYGINKDRMINCSKLVGRASSIQAGADGGRRMGQLSVFCEKAHCERSGPRSRRMMTRETEGHAALHLISPPGVQLKVIAAARRFGQWPEMKLERTSKLVCHLITSEYPPQAGGVVRLHAACGGAGWRLPVMKFMSGVRLRKAKRQMLRGEKRRAQQACSCIERWGVHAC